MKLFTVTGATSGCSWMTIAPCVVLTVAVYLLVAVMHIGWRPMNSRGAIWTDVLQPARAAGI